VATGTFGYSTQFEVQGNEIEVESTRTMRRVDEGDREVWRSSRRASRLPARSGTCTCSTIELEAPVFGSDAALEATLAGMSLQEGFQTPVRYAEVGMQQRVRFFQLKVDGAETVEVPAGSSRPGKSS
jgi:hypothetical protein